MSPSIRHARKHFSQAEGGQLDEVRQVMGMLAFPSDTHISPYKVSCPLKQARTLKRFFQPHQWTLVKLPPSSGL